MTLIRYTLSALLVALGAGCAAGGGTPAALPQAVPAGPLTPEQRLRQTLSAEVPDPHVLDTLSRQFGDPRDYHRALAAIASDTNAAEIPRGNAYVQLGKRYATDQAGVFAQGVADARVRVRASAAAGLGGLLAVSSDSLLDRLISVGLHDPDDRVQAKAIEALGDRSPDLLRGFLAERPGPSPEIRALAQQMLGIAENRGAALVPAADGSLAREVEGVHLRYEPRRGWPEWEASVGVLRIARAGAPLDSVAGAVEAVGNVVPAFVSQDGRYVVYESDRSIHVYDVTTRSRREIGPGIAPRVYPFLDSFFFLRERRADRKETNRAAWQLQYDVLRAPFAGGAAEPVAVVSAVAEFQRRGAYSPVRWMRVRESSGAFMIEADNMTNTILPDPFAVQIVEEQEEQ